MKKTIAVILSVLLVIGIVPVFSSAAEIVDSGTCGDNLTWTLDDEGTLTISGTGEMPTYYSPQGISTSGYYTTAPWGGSTAKSERVKAVIVEDHVRSIGQYVFYGCTSLASVTIGNSVTSIGLYAFYGCSSLVDVTIPDSVTSIGDNAFYGCARLHILCNKGSYAQTYAESNNYACALLDGTDEENTFSGTSGRLQWSIDRRTCTLTITCSGKMPTFSSGDVPWATDTYKKYVHSAVLEDGVTNIGQNAFYDCSSLESVLIPDSVTNIGDNAFYDCESLASVTIPDSVTSIGYQAFSTCTGLVSVTIPESMTSIGMSAFRFCTSLTSVTIPDSVTSIGNYAFYNCRNLTDVTIPDSVTSIEHETFRFCKCLISVDIPASVCTVVSGAFADCTNLESVYFYNRNCAIGNGATPANAVVYGYAGSTAETYADNNALLFREIDGNHEHHYTVTKEVQPTCTEDGYRNLFCPCGDRKTETIPSAGHTEVNIPATEPTCTEPGYSAYTYCSVCETVLTEKTEIPANGHTETTVNAIEATCGKDGFTGVIYCSICKEVLDEGEEIAATGNHTPGEAFEVIIAQPTCTAEGQTKTLVNCSVCGKTISETAGTSAALGHSDTNGDGRCDRCNAEMPSGGEATSVSNAFEFILQFFKMLISFFKGLF